MNADSLLLVLLFGTLLMGILSGIPIVLVLLGVPLLVAFVGSGVGAFDLTYLQAFPQRIFGLSSNTLLIAVPLFICMGVLLERSGTAERMLLLMSRLLGGSASSLAYAVLIVSTLIAASTGVIGATIIMLGLISLPAMIRSGLPVQLSSGLVCASGTLGQIIPPSVVLILLGDQISNTYLEAQHAAGNFAPEPVSVADLFAGALIPGLLLVSLYAGYVTIYTQLNPSPRTGRVRSDACEPDTADSNVAPLPETLSVMLLLRVFVPPLLLIMSVLGSILAGVATPTEAAAVGAMGALLLAASHVSQLVWIGRLNVGVVIALSVLLIANTTLEGGIRAHTLATYVALLAIAISITGLVTSSMVLWKNSVLVDVLRETVLVSAMVFGIIIGASMLSLVFRGLGGDEYINALLGALPGGEWGTLAIVLLVVFLLGFVLEFVEIIFIVVPIVGPILLATDFDPVWIAILLALNLQTSFLTPPFGFALFYFRSVAPASLSTMGIYRAVVPFVVLQLLALCLVARFPALVTWLPAQLK